MDTVFGILDPINTTEVSQMANATQTRSYRCRYHPKDKDGFPVVSETGALPHIQVEATDANAAELQAWQTTGCAIATVERMEADELVLDVVTGEPFQPFTVGTPVGGAVGGDTSIVVEVYALGAGITLVGQGNDLTLGQGAFELETHGERLVVDPGSAHQSHRLVSAIDGDVASIRVLHEAVDQEHLSELRFGDVGHGIPPLKTAILALPQGMGKSAISRAMARKLGCIAIVDEWNPDQALTPGALHLTNCEVAA